MNIFRINSVSSIEELQKVYQEFEEELVVFFPKVDELLDQDLSNDVVNLIGHATMVDSYRSKVSDSAILAKALAAKAKKLWGKHTSAGGPCPFVGGMAKKSFVDENSETFENLYQWIKMKRDDLKERVNLAKVMIKELPK